MPTRVYAAGHFQLTLDGVTCGFLQSVDGGASVAEVVSEAGPAYFTRKHLGPVSHVPFVVQFGLAMSKVPYDWISASWSGNYSRKDGAIVAADYNFAAISQRQFFNALLAETTFPRLDASSKDPAYLTLKFAPEYTRTSKASGKVTGVTDVAQKRWLPANFRVTIDGLDCTKISVVDSFTVKQPAASDDIGDPRDGLREPARLEFPNLTITLPESLARSWFDWFDDFAIKGNNDDSKEKKGSIAILSPNRTDELLRLDLFNLGIFRIGRDKTEANADRPATVTAHLYCERMELHALAATPKAVTRQKAAAVRKPKATRRR